VAGSYRHTPPDVPWIIHLAEGTDARAGGELAQLAGLGCLGANTVIVHGVGLSQADLDLMARHGAGLIWCPASNLFMFGQTAPIGRLISGSPISQEHARRERAGVTLALGSDSRLTGSQDLLAELQVAHSLGPATGGSAEQLFHMVTRDAARLLRIDGQVGTIEPGKQADLLILEGDSALPYQALVGAQREAVRLVFVGGRPVYGVAGFIKLFHAWGRPFTSARLGSRPYLVAADPVQRSTRRVVHHDLERLL
jgi:cytosine/adenosine deaminase-related metal-dependent hydrolase